MKKLILLILILNVGTLFSQSKESKLKLNDSWFATTVESEGKPVIVRGRKHLKNFTDSKQYNDHVEFVWTFNSQTNNGIPTAEENKLMTEIEDALIKSLEHDLQSILTIVYSHKNRKTWLFYTTSVAEFKKRVSATLLEFKKIPIQVSFNKDRTWNLYTNTLKKYGLEPR